MKMKKMITSLSYWTLLILLAIMCSSARIVKRSINWNGNNWAPSCDFNDSNLANVQTAPELCGPKCAEQPGCTHFTWTQYNGGICWMKTGPASKCDAFSTNDSTSVCGVLRDDLGGSLNLSANKRGIAWPLENTQDLPDIFSGGNISWLYNWSPSRTCITGAEFVPMLWSTNKGHDGRQFLNQARDATVVLGFNEPERSDQANMSSAEAVRAWTDYIEPLRNQGTRLGSPAISSTTEGLNWLQQFLSELDNVGGRIDFLSLHWYGRGVDNFINWITSVRQSLGNKYPVWVTEFACTSWNASEPVSEQEAIDFLRESIIRLDSLGWIERYAWFGAQRQVDAAFGSASSLISPNGELSELGQNYVYDF